MISGLRRLPCILLFTAALGAPAAWAGDGRTGWSATLYGGPASTSRASDLVTGRGKFTGGMFGLAVDRDLADLGWGVTFGAETQVTHYAFGKGYTTVALGIGLRFHDVLWGHATLAIYSGPSYALDPPLQPTLHHPNTHMKKFLNYIGIELAVPIPYDAQHWDAVLRIYHRSGAWGVYSINVDEGSMIGVGIRAKF